MLRNATGRSVAFCSELRFPGGHTVSTLSLIPLQVKLSGSQLEIHKQVHMRVPCAQVPFSVSRSNGDVFV
jgi:hypothetical protein